MAPEEFTEERLELIEQSAQLLYGLIHARFIVTGAGVSLMSTKFEVGEFGRCPRVCCEDQPVLPVGESDVAGQRRARVFCPRCQDIYIPRSRHHASLDGAFFGTTLPHLLLSTYPQLVPTLPSSSYTPRIFGFRIHSSAVNYPKAKKEENSKRR